jgi:hypothetical protein
MEYINTLCGQNAEAQNVKKIKLILVTSGPVYERHLSLAALDCL